MSTLRSLLRAFGLLCLAATGLLAWAGSEKTGDDRILSPDCPMAHCRFRTGMSGLRGPEEMTTRPAFRTAATGHNLKETTAGATDPAQRTASVQLTRVTLERGALTEAVIRQAFAQDTRLSRCVAATETVITQRYLPLTLMFTLVLRVDAEGQVTFVRPDLLDPLVTPCLIQAIQRWQLPAGGEATLVWLGVKFTLTTDPTSS